MCIPVASMVEFLEKSATAKEVWIVGQVDINGGQWQVQGVFSSKDKAIAACTKDTYFIGPVNLDEPLPDESTTWVGAYFPLT